MTTGPLDLTGGRLDLAVVIGRDGIFVIPTPDDLSAYTWAGQIRQTDGTLVGAFTFALTTTQATARIPAAVTTALDGIPIAEYEIITTAPGPGGAVTPLLSGQVLTRRGVVS